MKKKEDTAALPDEELTRLFQEDRREGFRLVYGKYADRLLSVCQRYAVDGQEAMDLMHEAMLKVYDKAGSFKFDGEGSLFRWMSRLAVNMILDKRKWKKRRPELDLDEVGMDVAEPGPEEVMEIPEELIHGMLERLSPVKRLIFNLYCVEEYSYKEIGQMLGISENGSSSTLSKVRKELAAMINEYLKKEE